MNYDLRFKRHSMFKATKSTAGAICKKDNIIEYSRNMECLYAANYENLPKPDSVRSTCPFK